MKQEKCIFSSKEVQYLGYNISENGIAPTQEKVAAIKNAPAPTNKKELQAFLGLVNFYHSFLKDKVNAFEPLFRLLDKNAEWKWTKECEVALNHVKQSLSSNSLLQHFDPAKPIVITCDASPWGIGCVLSHRESDGRLAPIAYHSVTMSKTERRYAQLDKEALAIVKSVKKFHYHVFGRKFEIQTDHKPLIYILGPQKSIPEMTTPRLMRYAMFLSNYDYELQYVPGHQIQNADALSRLPPNANIAEQEKEMEMGEILMLENLPERAMNSKLLSKFTETDNVLGQVLNYVRTSWPHEVEAELKPYHSRKDELSTYKNCVLWGSRVVVPRKAQEETLKMLHSTHIGIQRMKAIARSYVWWPTVDKDVENMVKQCQECMKIQSAPPKTTIHPWEWESHPWSRLHIDFAGPFMGHNFLLVVDSYSKWLDVKIVPSTSTSTTVKALREWFATHGIPNVIVSDNATCFKSEEFATFMKKKQHTSRVHTTISSRFKWTNRTVRTRIKNCTNEKCRR